jgi:hypothetical protein
VSFASLQRIVRTETELQHHTFLDLFWKQLQEFYKTPPEAFSKQAVTQWLVGAQTHEGQNGLKTVQEIVKTDIPPLEFGKQVQEALGTLAKHIYAEHFYEKISDPSTEANPFELHESFRNRWESIFKIVKKEEITPLKPEPPKNKDWIDFILRLLKIRK